MGLALLIDSKPSTAVTYLNRALRAGIPEDEALESCVTLLMTRSRILDWSQIPQPCQFFDPSAQDLPQGVADAVATFHVPTPQKPA